MSNIAPNWAAVLSYHCPQLIQAIVCRPQHVPCPLHGGKDGLRCFNDFDETGGMVCNSCGPHPNGYLVLSWALGISTQRAAALVKGFMQSNSEALTGVPIKEKHPVVEAVNLDAVKVIKNILSGSLPLTEPKASPARLYLKNRGIDLVELPPTLRFCESLSHDYQGSAFHPAIVAPISKDGAIVGLHRTYLTEEGHKIPVDAKKVFPVAYPGATTGGAIQLYPPGDELCVAEGIETALIIRQYLQKPVWAAQNAMAMLRMQLPTSIKKLIICADNDVTDIGVEAAKELATHAYMQGIEAHVVTPKISFGAGSKSVDWLDVLKDFDPDAD